MGEPTYMCQSDFIAPKGVAPDYIAAFANTGGLGCHEQRQKFEAASVEPMSSLRPGEWVGCVSGALSLSEADLTDAEIGSGFATHSFFCGRVWRRS